ncbi:FtsK/SpoIIIE domain-containing protein [Bacillus sp. ISL-46]|uniref:FtsK/SpoIIIE domain-containing protein n=1 Tax=Bacillus sp. ISL-46 TaxID=2819129 RepID=UPI0035AECB28
MSSSSDDTNLDCEQIQITELEGCYQEVYNREKVRELVLGINKNAQLTPIRNGIGDERPWEFVRAVLLPEDNSEETEDENDSGSFQSQTAQNQQNTRSDEMNNNEQSSTGTEESDNDESVEVGPPDFWGGSNLKEWIDTSVSQMVDDGSDEWLNEVERKLKTALMSYNLQAKVLGSRLTPNSGIIRLKGSDNLKVEDIERKKSQLLTTHALQVLNVVGRPGEIVVFIARPEREVIYLRDIWKRRKLDQIMPGMNMNFLIGVKEVDGELLYLNLGGAFEGLQQHAPHTLIAGATGSGKSILLQNLILDICATNSKEMAQVYLIDPKFGVDYQSLEDLPHLTEGIIIDQDKAASVLESLVTEMESRYLTFRENKVPNIKEYNKKAPEGQKMPLIFLIHDEFADWMLVDEYKNTVSSSVQRLGVKARAAGIHLIFAAQRPDKDALPVQLRDNLGNRLILKVESTGTSEIALGEKGAERLLDKGHLAARLSGESNLIFAQVPFLSSEDSFGVVNAIKKGTDN